MAEAQVRLEFSVGPHNEEMMPAAQLFNEYFGGGMAGLVFQELREARALAYSAWAHFFTPSRPDEENILVGSIGCQADKTLDAVHAFMELLENMPINQTRWESAHSSILSTYAPLPYLTGAQLAIFMTFRHWVTKKTPEKIALKEQAKRPKVLEDFYKNSIQPKK